MKTKLYIFLFAFLLIELTSAEVYIGTTEGYIYNTENKNVSDAKVVITVNQCSIGCSRETYSELSGYYVTANLNLPKLSMVTVYAEKETDLGLEYGSAVGMSNEYQAAEVNVRICLPPPAPALTDEPNSHDTTQKLEWNSFSDKKKYPTYDEFQLDSNPIIKSNSSGSKEIRVTNLTYSDHIWRVRTCNTYCCSQWVSDTFKIGNSPPYSPVLVKQPDTTPGKVTLKWESGVDPDGDETYDEYEFGIYKEKKERINATSPRTENVFGCNLYQWRVRTCEKTKENLCSQWSEESFFACGIECPACSPISPGGGSSSECPVQIKNETTRTEILERYITNTLYALFVSHPTTVYKNENFYLKISFSTTTDAEDIIFKANSSYFRMNDFIITKISNRNARFNMSGMPKNVRPGVYTLYLDVYLKGVKIISEPLEIEIKEQRFEFPYSEKFPWWLLLIVILVITITTYLTYKYLKKKGLYSKIKKD